jgi:hypothetical protein
MLAAHMQGESVRRLHFHGIEMHRGKKARTRSLKQTKMRRRRHDQLLGDGVIGVGFDGLELCAKANLHFAPGILHSCSKVDWSSKIFGRHNSLYPPTTTKRSAS